MAEGNIGVADMQGDRVKEARDNGLKC